MEHRSKCKKPRISPPSPYLNSTQQETHEKHYSKKKWKKFDQEFATYIRGWAPIAPVQLFYSQIHNLSEEDQFFDTYIEGKIHKITPQVIASLLGLERPSNPVCFPPKSEDELVVSKDEFRRAVYLPDHVNSSGRYAKSEIKVAHLKPIIAALVRICQSNILPAFNHHYVTNLNSIYLSFLLLNGYEVDISYVIWHTMSGVAPNSVRTKAVPYGIIVGQLLSYLGHPIPADTLCTNVPANVDVNFLCRNHLPYNPYDSNDSPLPQQHLDVILPPPAPPTTDHNDASELPLTLPNDPPTESIESLKDTLEVILSHIVNRLDRFEQQQQEMIDRIAREDDRREQQHQEFMQQKKLIEHIARQQDHLQQQHEEFSKQQKLIIDSIVTRQDNFQQQQQETIDRVACQEVLLEQQHDEFMQHKKTIEHIVHQQKHLQLQYEGFGQQHKMIIDGIVTQQDHIGKQQQEMLDRIGRQDSRLEQQHDEFMQQKKTIEHISHQQDYFQQQHEDFGQQQKLIIDRILTQQVHFQQQQQEMLDRIGSQDGRLEQQHDEFMQQKKTIEHIAHQQDHFQQQQQKLISDQTLTRQNHFEQQQKDIMNRIARQDDRIEHQQEEIAQLRKFKENQQDCLELRLEEFKQKQEMIGSITRKHDCLARRMDQHYAFLMQYVQRAFRDQGVNPVCQECGDSGYPELLIYCNMCQNSAEHSYCLDKKDGDDETKWTCEDCERTAELNSQQGLQVTSSRLVTEDVPSLCGGECGKESEKLDAEEEGFTPAS